MKYKKHIINHNKECLNQTDKKGKIIAKCLCNKCRVHRVWNQNIICGAQGGFETRAEFKKRANQEV